MAEEALGSLEDSMPENVYRRGAQYLYRRTVPEAIRTIVGKREIKVALGADYRCACRDAALLQVQTNQQFEKARQQIKDAEVQQDSLEKFLATPLSKRKYIEITKVTPELIDQVSNLWVSSLHNDLDRRKDGLSDDEYVELDDNINLIKPQIDRALATGNLDRFSSIVPFLLHCRGYQVALNGKQLRELTYEVLKSIQKGYAVLQERQKGNIVVPEVSGPVLPAAWELAHIRPKTNNDGPTWDQLLTRWETDRHRGDTNTVNEMKPIWTSLVAFAGKVPPNAFTKSMVTDWLKDMRDKLGNHPKTLEKKGTLAGAVFSLAVKDDILASNPFAGYSYKRFASKTGVVSATARHPFTLEDLQKIFHPKTGIASLGSSKGGGGNAARQWMPLIALYTGARLDEIGQLRAEDFSVSPVPHFKILRAKNQSSIRNIPIHPKLIELGLLEYVAARKAGLIFPELCKRGIVDPNSEVVGKWFIRQLKERLLPGCKGKVFHSFRHTFKDLCRNAGIPRDVHQELTGHTSTDVGDSYGDGFSLETKLRYLSSINLEIEFYRPGDR